MLFNSTAAATMNRVYLETITTAEQARQENSEKRMSFYEDDQISYLTTEMGKYFSNVSRLKLAFINILKKVVNSRSMVYMKNASREITGSSQDQQIFAEINRTAALPVKWKMANRYSTLLNCILLRPTWRTSKQLQIDLITPDIAYVETGESVEEIARLLITNYPANGKDEDLTFSEWTPKFFRKLDWQGRTMASRPNPYQGKIPFVPIWSSPPLSDFWNASKGEDLIVMQELINEKLVDLSYTVRHQGFSTGFIKGNSTGGTVQADPGVLVELQPDGEVGYAAAKAPISDIVRAIEFMIVQTAVSNGLSSSSLSSKTIDTSGVSRVAGNIELEELRRDQITLFAKYEQDLFDMIRTVWNTHNPTRRISDKATLKVDFYDAKQSISPDIEADTHQKYLDMNVISLVDIAMARNDDLTREAAMEALIKVQEENKILNVNTDI